MCRLLNVPNNCYDLIQHFQEKVLSYVFSTINYCSSNLPAATPLLKKEVLVRGEEGLLIMVIAKVKLMQK
tara:strand:- start:973 stop:1182 length:210 start_codon:yes stop_codon:yes gene_type:complete